MGFRAVHTRTAALAAAGTLLAFSASACSSSTPSASPTPNIPLGTSGSSSDAPSATTASSSASAGSTTFDPNALIAQKQQIEGCRAALVPVFDAFVKQTYPNVDEARAVSVVPAPAQASMQQALDQYKQILSTDANAATDGVGNKANKVFDAFCATPDGAKLVGTTPVEQLKPVPPPKPPKTTPPPHSTSTHH